MTDDQIENLLRRVRPAGPPPELRARILSASPPRRAWPWLAAAGALLMMVVSLQSSAGQLRQQIQPQPPASVSQDSEIALLQQTFGLTDDEMRALTITRDVDRMLAAEAGQQ